jgi:prepilin-type N-terminal cleavage/methylation domain-containing protein
VVKCNHALATRPGFSLLEMLVSLALMIVIVTMYYSYGSRSYQRQQKQACQANLEKIYVSLQIFANDHAGTFPQVPGAKTAEAPLDLLVPRYSADTTIFICPGSKDKALPAGESFLKRKISYAYYMGRNPTNTLDALMSDEQVNTASKAAGQLLFSATGKPPGNNHYKYGGNVMFGDGRVELSPTQSAFSLVLTQGVVLLNPKP